MQHLHPWKRVYRYEHRYSNEGVRDRANGQAHPPKRVNCQGIRKTKARTGASLGRIEGAQARALASYLKIDQHTFTSWQNWGSPSLPALSFPSFPHPEPLHLQYLNMSEAGILAGGHDFVARDNMLINANSVSAMVMM